MANTAVVTGAASGIGLATARHLAERGANGSDIGIRAFCEHALREKFVLGKLPR